MTASLLLLCLAHLRRKAKILVWHSPSQMTGSRSSVYRSRCGSFRTVTRILPS